MKKRKLNSKNPKYWDKSLVTGPVIKERKLINLGYKVCVNCSDTERYGCAPLINHKTGNSIQIMSSSDAAIIAKLTRRRGYGTMLK